MINIVNFSHPISSNDTSVAWLIDKTDDQQIMDIPVNLDLSAPVLQLQIEEIVTAAIKAAGDVHKIDFIRLPDLAEAAVLVVNEFKIRGKGYMPGILRFARTESSQPRFEAVEIMEIIEA